MNLIIGYGVVGANLKKIFVDADICDPEKGYTIDKSKKYKVAFVCVPTPSNPDGSADLSFVERAISENNAEVFCIKSTVPPGSTEKFNKPCVFSPEYAGETIDANSTAYDFVILGGPKNYTAIVAEEYKKRISSCSKIFQTDSKTAELTKYMENSFLAMKVAFCSEFYRVANSFDIDYDELRELWLLDPRIGRSHTFIFKDTPYYDSKCLNKDIPAIIKAAEEKNCIMDIMKAVHDTNNHQKSAT